MENKNKEEFEIRLNDCGLEVECTEVESEYKYELKNYSSINVYAFMGIIYHFSNRKWIVSDKYMYIMKSVHIIKFNN